MRRQNHQAIQANMVENSTIKIEMEAHCDVKNIRQPGIKWYTVYLQIVF